MKMLWIVLVALTGAAQDPTDSGRSTPLDRQDEERWELLEALGEEDPNELALQLDRFGQDRAHGLLEQWALYGAGDPAPAVRALRNWGAPNWTRTAVFLLDSTAAESIVPLLEPGAPRVLGWLELHGLAQHPFARRLRAQGVDARSGAGLDPPLDFGVVFGPALPDSRFRAPDEQRRQRVLTLRALRGLTRFPAPPEPWPGPLVDQLLSPDAELRGATVEVFGAVTPDRVPVERLANVWRPEHHLLDVRADALRAWSHGPEPRVHAELLALVETEDHVLWQVALERLGELGDEFALARLDRLRAALPPDRLAVLDATHARIRERLAATPRVARVRPTLERLTWADLACHPLESPMGRFVREELVAWTRDEEVVRELLTIYRSYVSDPWLAAGTLHPAGFDERVKQHALRLLPD